MDGAGSDNHAMPIHQNLYCIVLPSTGVVYLVKELQLRLDDVLAAAVDLGV